MFSLSRRLVIAASLGALTIGSAATADTPPSTLPVVVELFTSQGCSSCPPSNKLVRQIAADHPDIIALSYSVDYWDYLGWKDTLADRRFTERQYAYALSLGKMAPYTPQIVINGREDAPGFTPSQILSKPLTPSISLSLSQSGSSQRLNLSSDGPVPPSAAILVVRYKPGVTEVNVGGGENRGKAIRLANVVDDITYLGDWSGQDSIALPDRAEGYGYAVLVQSGQTGPILAAIKSP